MDSIFYKYLIAHGVTNFVDIDGLVYAAVPEVAKLWSSGFLFGLVVGLIAGSVLFFGCIVHMIRRNKKHAA